MPPPDQDDPAGPRGGTVLTEDQRPTIEETWMAMEALLDTGMRGVSFT
jgi:hypothetical protein